MAETTQKGWLTAHASLEGLEASGDLEEILGEDGQNLAYTYGPFKVWRSTHIAPRGLMAIKGGLLAGVELENEDIIKAIRLLFQES